MVIVGAESHVYQACGTVLRKGGWPSTFSADFGRLNDRTPRCGSMGYAIPCCGNLLIVIIDSV